MSDNNLSLMKLDSVILLDAIEFLDRRMSRSNKRMGNLIRSLDNKITTISADVVSLRADITELKAFATDTAASAFTDQAKAFADAHNDASKFANSHIDNRNTQLYTLRTQENKEISGFPRNISHLDGLSLSEISHILKEYGCDVDEPDYNCMSRGDAYGERELRSTLHFHLGIADNFPIKI